MIHPILDRFDWTPNSSDDIWSVGHLGARTRHLYNAGVGIYHSTGEPTPENPIGPEEELFEWIDLLEAVTSAKDTFVMIELGAGYGRWIAYAAAALRQLDKADYQFIGVEAEPTHFEWLRENLVDNGIDLDRCRLINAAVNHDGAPVFFQTRTEGAYYGQAIYSVDPVPLALLKRFVKRFVPRLASHARQPICRVDGVTLTSILEPLPHVDLIDMDIQGAEGQVVHSSLPALTQKVRRLHIETHNVAVEKTIRADLSGAGWKCLNDYPYNETCETPYGPVFFQGGLQSWMNPRLTTE